MAGMMNDRLRAKLADPADPTAPDVPVEVPADDGAVDDVVDDDDDEGAPNVSPEEQAQYEDFVSACRELIYEGGQINERILGLLDEDPADIKELFGDVLPLDEPTEDGGTLWEREGNVIALAAATVAVVVEVAKDMQESDTLPDGDIIFHAGREVLEDIAETSRETGHYQYNQKEVSEAFRKAVDLYREAGAAEGLVDLDVAKQEFNQIVAADKAGMFEPAAGE
jgi:hypothetical protein